MSVFSASLIFTVALFPGLFFGWAYGQIRPLHSGKAKDWFLRYASMAGGWLAVGAWPLHWLYMNYWSDLVDGKTLPWPVYLAPIGYLTVPAFSGWSAGQIGLKLRGYARRYPRMARALGPGSSPTAWDHLFDSREAGFIRCRLRSGRWVGGLYDCGRYITSFASDGKVEQDLYIAAAVQFDQETGDVISRGADYAWTQGGLYLRSRDIETLDFIPIPFGAGSEEEGAK